MLGEVLDRLVSGRMRLADWKRLRRYVVSVCVGTIVGQEIDPEDVAQEVLLHLQNAEVLRNIAASNAPSAYVSQAVKNAVFDFGRKLSREKTKCQEYAEKVVRCNIHTEPPDVELIREERKQVLEDRLSLLNPINRRIVVQFAADGKSFRDIAEQEGMSVDAVRRRYARARTRLRHLWRQTVG